MSLRYDIELFLKELASEPFLGTPDVTQRARELVARIDEGKAGPCREKAIEEAAQAIARASMMDPQEASAYAKMLRRDATAATDAIVKVIADWAQAEDPAQRGLLADDIQTAFGGPHRA